MLLLPSRTAICFLLGVALPYTLVAGCSSLSTPETTSSLSEEQDATLECSLEVGHWPGWRGGEFHGVSPETGLPVSWSATHGVRWKTEVPGQGNSSPVVWHNRIFLSAVVPGDNQREELALLCLDRRTGSLLWQRELGTPSGRTHRKNGYAAASVAVDGRRVFAFFGGRGLFCYDLDGHRLWHAGLGNLDHEWGLSSSPILYGDLVIQNCDSESQSYLAAFDRASGQLVWRTPRDSCGSWSTPALVHAEANGQSRVELVVNGTGRHDGSAGYVIAYDPVTGQPLWHVRGTTDIPCPTAMVGSGLLISASGGNGPLLAIRPGGEGDVTETHVEWRQPSGGPYVPTGLIYHDRLYMISDGGVASCRDLSGGSLLWRKRLRGTFSASLVAGEDRIYAVSEQGEVHVLAAAETFQWLATNRMEERCLATPAIAQGEIFLRTERHLYCIANEPGPEVASGSHDEPAPADPQVLASPSDLSAERGPSQQDRSEASDNGEQSAPENKPPQQDREARSSLPQDREEAPRPTAAPPFQSFHTWEGPDDAAMAPRVRLRQGRIRHGLSHVARGISQVFSLQR